MHTNLSTVQLVTFIIYTLICLAVGLWATVARKRTGSDYWLASREVGPWLSAISVGASAESGWVMLGLVGAAFAGGVSAFWIVPGCLSGYVFNFLFVAERMRRDSAATDAQTLPEYLSHRFNRTSIWLRVVSVTVIGAATIGYLAAQLNASGKAMEASFNVPYQWGVIIGIVAILSYTVTGGFRASVYTDVLQGWIMIVTLTAIPILALIKVG